MIEKHNHIINTDLVQILFKEGLQDTLYFYSVSSYLLRGLGYMDKKKYLSEITSFCSISRRTATRWLDNLKDNQFITEKKGILYIKGKKTLLKERGIISKNAISIKPTQLKSKKVYKTTVIEQIGILYQNRLRFIHGRMVKNQSLESEAKLKSISLKKENVGCSLSLLSLKLSVSKSTASNYIKNKRRVKQIIDKVSTEDFKRRYSRDYFIQNPTLSYRYCGKSFIIEAKLPSVITSKSQLKRSTL